MSSEVPGGRRIDATVEIHGDQSGQFAIGNDNWQQQITGEPPTAEELQALREDFRALQQQVTDAAPPELRDEAEAKVAELENAVVTDEPDLTTMEYVRNWFIRRLPSLAETVTGLIVHPIVGKLVGAAGDALAAEFNRRFGSRPAPKPPA